MGPAARLLMLLAASLVVGWALVANRSGSGLPLLPNLAAALAVGLVAYVYIFKRN